MGIGAAGMCLSPVDDRLNDGAVGGGGGGARLCGVEVAATAPGMGGGSRLARLLALEPGVMGDVGDIGDCSVPKYEALFVFVERGELGASDLGGARGASDVGLKAKF
jgi:hypothetical protein